MGENIQEIMWKHLEEDLVLMSELSPGLAIPAELESVVARCLGKEPDRRFQTMSDFRNDLELIRAGMPKN